MLASTPIALVVWQLILPVADAGGEDCRLWIAPSHTSTEQETRYGIYAGKAYRQNDTFPLSEIAIPLVDMIESFNRDTILRDSIIDFVESNLWTAEYAGSKWEGWYSAPAAIPGIGSLPQYHTGIANVDFLQSSILLRDRPKSPKSGTPHPSRGAITPYYNATLRATQDIPAGMELFADFGDDWDGNFTDDFYQDKFTRYDYMLADEIIRELVGLYKDFSNLTLDFQEDILDFVLGRMLSAAAGKHAKTIKSLIPENPRKLQKVLDAGGTFMYRYPDMIQSTKWLSSHGYCLDTLQMGPSTIPHAGRGAFATRSFQRGDIVTLTPMMHIADKSVLEIYDLETIQDPDTGSVVRVNNYEAGLSGYQLLMNYCFGHSESSLLLFPLGSHAGLINHDKSPNAYITWSRVADNNLPNQHAFQDVSVDAMAEVNRIVVVMKIVAIRPIEEGEEVTIDYGDEWVSAWEDYMRDWEYYAAPHPHPLQPDDLRDQYRNKPLKIPAEILADPYPANVATACYLSTREREDGLPQHDGVIEITQWDPPDDGRLFVGTRLFVADIMERQKTGNAFFYNYTVLARAEGKQGFQKVVNVPHEVCVFVNKPYTSDIHTDGAFRHPIGIRDDRFPQAWRNLR